jgi:glycosyltransferase involved in cell wall biosynthesis
LKNNNKIFVSVIIPTFNRANDLRRALDSLTLQSFTLFEVIICDDGSTDNTNDVINEYLQKLNIVYLKINNSGKPAVPRNIAISKAKGIYIAFLDSDDWWDKDKLQISIEILESGYDLVYSDFFSVKSEKKISIIKVRSLSNDITKDLLVDGNPICNSSVVIRKSILDLVGPLNEGNDFIAWEDFDLWLRTSIITNKFYHISIPLVYYWDGGGNISTEYRKILIWQAIINYYIKDSNYSCPRIYKSIGHSLFRSKKYYYCLPYLGFAFNVSNGLDKVKLFLKIFFVKLKILSFRKLNVS